MTTTNSMNTKFEFRTKFKKLMNDENSQAIIRAFEKFCSLESEDALDVLWRMTYSQDKAFEEVYKLGMDNKMISSESFLVLRNELRYQYEKLIQPEFTSFWTEYDDEKIQEAYLILEKCTDSIVASVVYDYCHEVLDKPVSDISRILFLLKSDKENNYFGGIRSMDFHKPEEAEYLKQYHIEIHNLLEALNTFVNEENFELPFYMEEEENEEEITSELKKLTPEEILAHKEVFKAFEESNDFNLLVPISQLGFDLNEVIIKKEEIYNLIKAIEAFEK